LKSTSCLKVRQRSENLSVVSLPLDENSRIKQLPLQAMPESKQLKKQG